MLFKIFFSKIGYHPFIKVIPYSLCLRIYFFKEKIILILR